jgi:hypothetical protein
MPQNVFEAMRVGERSISTHIHLTVFLSTRSLRNGHGVVTSHRPHTARRTAVHINDSCFLVWTLKLAVTTLLEITNEKPLCLKLQMNVINKHHSY